MNRLLSLGALAALLVVVPARAGVFGPTSDLLAQKTAPESAVADSDITYQISVTNLGPDPAASVTLSDPLPGDLTFVSLAQDSGPTFLCTDPGAGNNGTVSCSIASLAVGQSGVFTLVAHVPAQAPNGTNYTNIATATTQSVDPNDENNAGVAGTNLPTALADAGITKTAVDRSGPGVDLTYTVVVLNGGPDAAVDLQWTDTLPGDLTFVSLTQDSGPTLSCTTPAAGAGGTVQCGINAFPAGTTASFTLVAHIPDNTPSGTEYTNTATVASATPDPNSENDASTITTIISALDLAATKSGPASANAGAQIVYTLGIANTGPDDAVGAVLADALPAPLTFASITQATGPVANCAAPPVGSGGSVSCSFVSLAAGASATFELVANVPASAPNGTVATNTVTAGAPDQFDTDTADNAASVQTTLVNTADVGVAKSGPATANAGGTVAWTITVSNNGPDAAANVTLADTLPAGTTFVSLATSGALDCTTPAVGSGGAITCSLATLASGASAQAVLTAQVSNTAADASSIDNTANVASAAPADPNGNNNSASSTTLVVNRADLGVTKSAPASVVAGNTFTYTLTASNAGPLADSATLTDVLPAGTTFVSLVQTTGATFACTAPAAGAGGNVQCTNAAFASGASASFALTVRADAALADGSSILNTASIDGARADANAGNDSATATTAVVNQADLAVTKTGPASANAGQTLVYTITLSNTGPAAATGVSLSDAIPANTTFVSLAQAGTALSCTTPAAGGTGTVTCTAPTYANGATSTLTLTVRVNDPVASPVQITNAAAVTSSSVDPNTANNSASANTTATSTADLGIAKSASATVVAGGTLAYTLAVTNAGPLADTATLQDTLPAGTTFASLVQTAGPAFACTAPAAGAGGTVSCTGAGFASGASASFTLTVNVALSNANGAVLANTATVDGTRTDPNPANDSATANTTVSNQPNVSVAKTAPPQVAPGGNIAYTLDVANTGNAAAQSVVLTDALPAQARFVSVSQASGPAFACTAPAVGANGTVTCTLASLAAGASARFTLTVSVAPGSTGTITNTANVTTTSADAAAGDNASAAGTLIGFAPGSFAPITIPTLSWFGLLALAAAVVLLGGALVQRAR